MDRRAGRTTAARSWACGLMATALLGCGAPAQDEDLEAMGACSDAVGARVPDAELRATVRDDGADRWIVNVWADEPAEGTPDYRCEVVRDEQEDEGFRVVSIRP